MNKREMHPFNSREKRSAMCDLFALSAGKDYSAPKSLPIFAARAQKNMDGWGIGYFKNRNACIEKSANGVFQSGQLHDSFQRLARLIKSRIIICHVRLQTSGVIDECHAHPFVLNFMGYNWIYSHNGKAPEIESYQSSGSLIKEAVSDSARSFEFLRDQLNNRYEGRCHTDTLFDTLARATEQMIDEYPGKYNFLLSNGQILFAFTNHRQFMVLKGSQQLEGALLLTTVAKGLSDEKWLRIAKPSPRKGLLMAISGKDIILNQSF